LGETFRSRILSSGSGRGARWCFDFAEATGGTQSNSVAQSNSQATRPPHNPNNSEQGVIKDRQIVMGNTRVSSLFRQSAQSAGESSGDNTASVGCQCSEPARRAGLARNARQA